jgi:hypothetical protein
MGMENNEKQCSICSSNVALLQVRDQWICRECLNVGIENLTLPWKESLEVLFKEYVEKCNGCTSADHPEFILQARVKGQIIRAVLEFLGLTKNHELFLAVRKMNRLLTKARETAVFLDEVKNKSNENKTYAALAKIGAKKQQKQQKQLFEKVPFIINDSFVTKIEKFIHQELVFDILPIVNENVLSQDEERCNQLVEEFQQSVIENGQTASDTVKILHAVLKKSTFLCLIYHYLNETFDESFQEKETYYKNLQQQFRDINDAESLISQIKVYESKINAPKSEIDHVKSLVKDRLGELLKNGGCFEVAANEIG